MQSDFFTAALGKNTQPLLPTITFDVTELKQYTLNKYINAERRNKFIASKLKKAGTEFARETIQAALDNGVQVTFPCKLHLNWILPDRRVDPDNWSFCIKYLLDGAIKAVNTDGTPFLAIDNVANIVEINHAFSVSKEHPRLTIEFEELQKAEEA